MTDRVYRIVRDDGLYSNGGTDPDFNKQGKTWSTLGQLKNHLKLFYRYDWQNKKDTWNLNQYKDCSIVVYEMVVTDVVKSVSSFIAETYPEKK